jgi:hypothetical protein
VKASQNIGKEELNLSDERKALFSEEVPAGSKTYYLDVKQTKDGLRYLVIGEARTFGSGQELSRVMVMEANLADFYAALGRALDSLEQNENHPPAD